MLQNDLDNISCVVFDLDGTLYNKRFLPLYMVLADWRHITLLRAERKARKHLAGKYFGDEKALYAALFAKIAEQTNKTVAQVKNWYETIYMPTMVSMLKKHYTLQSWVIPTLKQLHERNIRIVVFSDYGCVKEKLEALQLSIINNQLSIYSAPEMGGLKPCKEAFENLLHILGVQPEQALMVGDRQDTDGVGAANVGMRFRKI